MDALDRLYWRLVRSLQQNGAAFDRPITIAEIYQQLVPYRAVRAELGFGELAEYEHALLRLLAGERGYVEVEVAQVRDEFRRELTAPNPLLGLYRDYAAVGVRVTGPRPPMAPRLEAHPGGSPAAPATPSRTPAGAPAGVACPGCGGRVPTGPEVRYCPHCGRAVRPVPCPECRVPIEPTWNYCVSCGRPRPNPAAS
jgi:hypothetical protein